MISLTETVLPALYRAGLRMTRRRGALTLGRINHRLFPRGQHFRLPTGERFFLPPDPHFFGYLHGHEAHIARLIEELVRPGDTCLDVGANIGYFTARMAAICGARGQVVAYEPDVANFAWLQRNADLSREAGHRVETVQAAVSEGGGRRRVVPGAESTLHTTVVAQDGDADAIAAVSVDDEIARLDLSAPVRLVKIDVEGHEPGVLRGMARSVKDGMIRHVVMEVSPGDHARELERIVESWGDAVASCRLWREGRWQSGSIATVEARTDAVVHLR